MGAPGGSSEGGEDEFEELRWSWERSSRISACNWAICCRACSKAARRIPHSGQGAGGSEGRSFMNRDDNEMNADYKPVGKIEPFLHS